MSEDCLFAHTRWPMAYLAYNTDNAKPVAAIERNILLINNGDEISEPGDEEIPDMIAKGVAISPKPSAK